MGVWIVGGMRLGPAEDPLTVPLRSRRPQHCQTRRSHAFLALLLFSQIGQIINSYQLNWGPAILSIGPNVLFFESANATHAVNTPHTQGLPPGQIHHDFVAPSSQRAYKLVRTGTQTNTYTTICGYTLASCASTLAPVCSGAFSYPRVFPGTLVVTSRYLMFCSQVIVSLISHPKHLKLQTSQFLGNL